MKIGVCLEMFFTDRPFVERIAAAGQAGCRYAEMWFIEGKEAKAVRTAAAQAGVTMTNAVIGAPDGGTGGGLVDRSHRREWRARTKATLKFCREAGIGAAIVCTGNTIEGHSAKRMRRSVLDGLKITAELAEKYGIDLFLEPLNDKIDHPHYFLTGSDEAAALCREVASPRLKVLFDCYHMQIMEGDLTGHIRRNLDVIGHIHSAGHPGRHELWLGETNYPAVLQVLESAGYNGVFALEYVPSIDHAESLRRALDYLQRPLP